MIKLKSFPIEKYEEANDFMEFNAPRSTEKQSGVVFHNGHIVIIYDDGQENLGDLEGKIKTQMAGDRNKRMLSEHSLEEVQVALPEATTKLISLKPEGYVQGMSNAELKRILEKEGKDTEGIKAADYAQIRDTIDAAQQQVDNLENQKLMDEHEVRRLTYSVKAWEKMLEKLK